MMQYGGEKVIFLIRLTLLARLLTPYDFGLLAIASLVIDVLMRLSNFGMTTALVQLDEASQEHYDSAWTMEILRGSVIAVCIFFASPFIADYLKEPGATNVLRALAFRPVLDATASIMIIRFSRDLDFRSLVFLQLPKAIINTILSVTLAREFGIWALVAGTLAGSLVYLIQSYIVAPHIPRFVFHVSAIRPLVQFGRWVLLTSIVVMLSQTLMRIVISRQLGASELGMYYLASSLAFIPTDIANQIVGAVSFPFYSRLQRDFKEVTMAFKSIVLSVGLLLLPISILMIAIASTLVNDIFGQNWMGTVSIIRILLVVNIFDIVGETITPILNGTGHPNKILVIEAIQSMALISLVTSLTNAYGAVGAALAWLPATILSQIVGLFFLRRILVRPLSGLYIPLVTIILSSLVGAFLAIETDLLIPGWIGFILASLIGILSTGLLLWMLERRFSLGLLNGLHQAFPPLTSWLGIKPRYEI